jgi:hypothetical protein
LYARLTGKANSNGFKECFFWVFWVLDFHEIAIVIIVIFVWSGDCDYGCVFNPQQRSDYFEEE